MLKFLLIPFLSKWQQFEEKSLRTPKTHRPKNKIKYLNARFKHINLMCSDVQKGLKNSIWHFKN